MTDQWAREVQAALLAEDTQRLGELFLAALAVEGHEQAARSWLAAVSAFDADAQSG